MTEALATFVKTAIEEKYVKSLPFNFPAAYVDAKPEVRGVQLYRYIGIQIDIYRDIYSYRYTYM